MKAFGAAEVTDEKWRTGDKGGGRKVEAIGGGAPVVL
jgi:hypothetical protein